jgi:hypothetical protein
MSINVQYRILTRLTYSLLGSAAHLRVAAEEFFETPLVFEKPGEIVRRGANFHPMSPVAQRPL